MIDEKKYGNAAVGWNNASGIIFLGPPPPTNPKNALQKFRDFYRENEEEFNEIIAEFGMEEVLTAAYLGGIADGSRMVNNKLVTVISDIAENFHEDFVDQAVNDHMEMITNDESIIDNNNIIVPKKSTTLEKVVRVGLKALNEIFKE